MTSTSSTPSSGCAVADAAAGCWRSAASGSGADRSTNTAPATTTATAVTGAIAQRVQRGHPENAPWRIGCSTKRYERIATAKVTPMRSARSVQPESPVRSAVSQR